MQGDETHTDETFKVPKKAASMLTPLDKAIRAAMDKSESDLKHKLGDFHCPDHVNFQDSVMVCNHIFTTYRTSEKHSVIFFCEEPSADSLVPAIVDAILLVPQDGIKHVFLAVHRYLALPASLLDPFTRYPDFGANLWLSETQKEITIVLGSCDIYHVMNL